MSAPRRPTGLRANQLDAWEQEAADFYGGPTVPRPMPPDEPPWDPPYRNPPKHSRRDS